MDLMSVCLSVCLSICLCPCPFVCYALVLCQNDQSKDYITDYDYVIDGYSEADWLKIYSIFLLTEVFVLCLFCNFLFIK